MLRAVAGHPAARLVNRLPVLMNVDSDPNMGFVLDDNWVGDEDGVPFKNGEQFYYYVAARDLLGREQTVTAAAYGSTALLRAGLSAPQLAAVEQRYGVDPAQIEDVIMGCVMQVGNQSVNVGRSA